MSRLNIATPEGRELGAIMAKQGRDDRCPTCAFKAGEHIANGSPETLLTALECALEREPLWCHESDRPCGGWQLMRVDAGAEVAVPWGEDPMQEAASRIVDAALSHSRGAGE